MKASICLEDIIANEFQVSSLKSESISNRLLKCYCNMITKRRSCILISCIGLVYILILSINWCFDPAMDHHQGDGNSLLHQVASCYSSHSPPLPHWRDGESFFPQSRVGLNCHTRNEVKTPAAMGGSNSAIWPGIQLTTMQTTGTRRPSKRTTSPQLGSFRTSVSDYIDRWITLR